MQPKRGSQAGFDALESREMGAFTHIEASAVKPVSGQNKCKIDTSN
jgi:hypothetical protein